MGDKFKYKNSENWTHEKCDAKFRNNNSKQSPINMTLVQYKNVTHYAI